MVDEVKLGPLTLKGSQAFSYLGWIAAIGIALYAGFGPPADLKVQVAEVKTEVKGVKDDVAQLRQDLRLRKRPETLALLK